MTKKSLNVLGRQMAYVDRGAGEPILFLHGNPTSSFLWRNVIAPLESHARCIAPDLIGMGDSDKLPDTGPNSYSFFEHRRYLDAFIDGLALDRKVLLVIHDWGSALGFDWAMRHSDRVRGIVYMESIVGELHWKDWTAEARALFGRFRSPEGEQLVLEQNMFVDVVLPAGIIRQLTEQELAEYRRPFTRAGESRRPTLSFPRQLPIEGEPADVVAEARKWSAWLATSPVPKLFVNAEPGRMLVGEAREMCRRWPNQKEITVRGRHFVQEDSAAEIATAILEWMP